jgi:exodeoxyribonuclease-3
MGAVKLTSWNVNGLRAALGKGLLDWIAREDADVICLQEVKAMADQVEVEWPAGYSVHWNSAERKGYSGTLTLSRLPVVSVERGLGSWLPDNEGRVLTVELHDRFVVNCYTPNTKRDLSRLPYREQQWDPAFLTHLKALESRKPVVFCGDLNVAHEEIDLANPKANVRNHGFTVEERRGFTRLMEAGFVDTFRDRHPGQGGHYTWWSPMAGARARNVGWRIDYFGISGVLRPALKEAFIRPAVLGSDHCPVGLVLG